MADIDSTAQVWRRRPAEMTIDSSLENSARFKGSIAYIEASSSWFMGTCFLNYELVFHENWSARIGGGGGFAENIANGYGGLLMANYFSGGAHKFDVGAGICYAGIVDFQLEGGKSQREWKITPVISGGYRYQPDGKGMFFRAGVSYFSFGGGSHLGIGLRL